MWKQKQQKQNQLAALNYQRRQLSSRASSSPSGSGYGSSGGGSYGGGYAASGGGFYGGGLSGGGGSYGGGKVRSDSYGHSSSGYSQPSSGYSQPSYGYSQPSYASYSSGYGKMECPGIPIALLLITLLGILTLGVIFFLKVQAAGRRKRSVEDQIPLEDLGLLFIIGRSPLLANLYKMP